MKWFCRKKKFHLTHSSVQIVSSKEIIGKFNPVEFTAAAVNSTGLNFFFFDCSVLHFSSRIRTIDAIEIDNRIPIEKDIPTSSNRT